MALAREGGFSRKLVRRWSTETTSTHSIRSSISPTFRKPALPLPAWTSLIFFCTLSCSRLTSSRVLLRSALYLPCSPRRDSSSALMTVRRSFEPGDWEREIRDRTASCSRQSMAGGTHSSARGKPRYRLRLACRTATLGGQLLDRQLTSLALTSAISLFRASCSALYFAWSGLLNRSLDFSAGAAAEVATVSFAGLAAGLGLSEEVGGGMVRRCVCVLKGMKVREVYGFRFHLVLVLGWPGRGEGKGRGSKGIGVEVEHYVSIQVTDRHVAEK